MSLGAIVMVLVQASIGMAVNLYVTVPGRHPGARPSNFFSGSFHSVVWAIGHGPIALAIHASFGIALVLMAIGVLVRSFSVRRASIRALAILGALLIIGAAFNGASFLDFNKAANSLIMALLAFAAVTCYAILLFLLEPQS